MAKVGRMLKDSMIDEASALLGKEPKLFVTSIRRLAPLDADALRQKLHGSQARLRVMKRSLGLRVLESLKIDGLADAANEPGGSIGLIVADEDILPAAKHLTEFIKEHADHLAIRGGVLEGRLLTKQNVEELASLPPKPVLLAQVLATIESPLADVVFTIERLIGDVAWIAEQAATAKPQAPTGSAEGQPTNA